MAYSPVTRTIFDGGRKLIYSYVWSSDGSTGGTTTIDASTYNENLNGDSPTYLDVNKVWHNISVTAAADGMLISFDADTDDNAMWLTGSDSLDFSSFGGVTNPRSTGVSGDVLITAPVTTQYDSATIIIEFLKRYESLSQNVGTNVQLGYHQCAQYVWM